MRRREQYDEPELMDQPLERYFGPDTGENQRNLSPRDRVIQKARNLGKIAFIDTTEIARGSAKDAAHEQYRREMNAAARENQTGFTAEGEDVGMFRRVGNWAKKVWKGNYAREYYQEKKTREFTRNAFAAHDAHYGQGLDEINKQQENTAIADRFCSDMDGMVRTEMGERIVGMRGTDDNRWHRGINHLRMRISHTARRFVENGNRMTQADFEAAVREHIDELVEYARAQGLDINEIFDSRKVFAHNLSKMVKVLQEARDHEIAYDQLGLKFDVVLGRARSAIVEAHQQNAVEKLKRHLPGALVANESLLPAALVVAGNIFSRKAAVAAGGLVAGVALSGAIAYGQEKGRVLGERVEDTRAVARGRNLDGLNAPGRAAEIRRTMLDMVPASDLIYEVNQSINELVNLDAYNDPDMDPVLLEQIRYEARQKFEAAVSALADAEIRMKILAGTLVRTDPDTGEVLEEAQKGRQTIKFSFGRENQERRDLEEALGRARRNLDRYGRDANNNAVLNYTSEVDGSHIDQSIDNRIGTSQRTAEDALRSGINRRDAVGNNLAHRLARNKALITMATGLVAGGLVQEGLAFASDDTQGLIETAVNGNNSHASTATMAETVREFFTGNMQEVPTGHAFPTEIPGESIHTTTPWGSPTTEVHNTVQVRLPDGYGMSGDAQHGFTITDASGHTVVTDYHPTYNNDGSLNLNQLERTMHDAGIQVGHDTPASVSTVHGYDAVRESVRGSMENVTIKGHWDNDTGATWDAGGNVDYHANYSELNLDYAGDHGTGVEISPTGERTFVMSVREMMTKTAHHNGNTLNIGRAVMEGKESILLHPTLEDHVSGPTEGVRIPIGRDGMIRVSENSAAGKFWSVDTGGHAQLHGQAVMLHANGDGTYSTVAREFGDNWSNVSRPVFNPEVVDLKASVDVGRPDMQAAYIPVMSRDALNTSKKPEDIRPWNPTPPEQNGIMMNREDARRRVLEAQISAAAAEQARLQRELDALNNSQNQNPFVI